MLVSVLGFSHFIFVFTHLRIKTCHAHNKTSVSSLLKMAFKTDLKCNIIQVYNNLFALVSYLNGRFGKEDVVQAWRLKFAEVFNAMDMVGFEEQVRTNPSLCVSCGSKCFYITLTH